MKLTKEDIQKIDEFEQLDELSKGTLGRYINKAHQEGSASDERSGYYYAKSSIAARDDLPKSSDAYATLSNRNKLRALKRSSGIRNATKKLTKEDFEQLNELSKGTLKSYIKKASKERYWAGNTAGYHFGLAQVNHPHRKEAKLTDKKREKGIGSALDKLTKD